MCGAQTRTRKAIVEASVMNVCSNCEKFGKPLEGDAARLVRPGMTANVAEGLARREKRMGAVPDVFSAQQMTLELVEDYPQRIKTARERKGWTREQLGARVKEPEHAMMRIESGGLRPSDDAAKRLERELGITLFEKVGTVATARKGAARGFTLGDMIKPGKEKDE